MIGSREVYGVNLNSFGSFHAIVVTLVILFILMAMFLFFHRSRLVLYAMILEMIIGLYIFLFLVIVNTEDPNLIFWLTRWLYTIFVVHTLAGVYAISYMNQQRQVTLKLISFMMSLVIIGLIFSNDRLMITRAIEVTTFSCAVKGPWIGLVFLYMFLIGVVFVVQCMRLYRTDKDRYVATWPIYFGMIFIAFYGSYAGLMLKVKPTTKPTIYVNVLGFSLFLMIYLFKEIKKTRQDREMMLEAYIYDDLTQVYSRNYVLEEIGLRASRRQMETSYVAMIDIDGFKGVNDTYGHMKGDRLLREVGAMLKDMSEEDWIPGRIGGDEFLVFIQSGDKEAVFARFIQLLHTFRAYTTSIRHHACCHEVGLSIGLIEVKHHTPLLDVLGEVDDLMYSAKKDGKNGIESNWGASYRLSTEEGATTSH